ncbi:signal peptidase I [Rheinheimera sp. UJ51]|uniref:signal peptidase I n=1 Tax=Rheinheimera sp. UJ51 TaxID=2892446 RepID=UPI001E54F852|nr:signal peptidase I [Rheinheimera sp. UJ51]MCC5453142.1 signal peptidase I [Rheinheimera sp. UJ51]
MIISQSAPAKTNSNNMSKKWLWLFVPLLMASMFLTWVAFSTNSYIANITGISMLPLIKNGDKAFMQSVGSKIEVGKIHGVSSFKTSYSETGVSPNLMKRIIAGPGDTLVFHASTGEWLSINGQDVVISPAQGHEDLFLTNASKTYKLLAGEIEHLKTPIYRVETNNVNDMPITFAYLNEHADVDHKVVVHVPDDHYFVMSDNWLGNLDSRYFGPIHKRHLRFKVVAVLPKHTQLH